MFVCTVSTRLCLSIVKHFVSSHEVRACEEQEKPDFSQGALYTDCGWMRRIRSKVKKLWPLAMASHIEMGKQFFCVFLSVPGFCFCNSFQN